MANRPALGIDFGTSHTVAVLTRPDGQVLPLLFDGWPVLGSAVYANPGGGELLVGRDADHAARQDPAGYEPHPKQRIDDGHVLLAGQEIPVAALIGAVLARVAQEAQRVAGGPVGTVTLTHPASWGAHRRQTLAEAARRAGMEQVRLVSEPVAAAAYFSRADPGWSGPGSVAVVYDLGAGTFDASVVRRSGTGVRRSGTGWTVLASHGRGDVGGLDVDAAVVASLADVYAPAHPELWQRLTQPSSATDRRANRQLWDDVRAAKEMLTRHPVAPIHIPLLDTDAPLGREQLDDLARPVLDRTVATTRAVLDAARVSSIDRVYLVGGASRMPLVASLLHRALGVAPTVIEQPELVVALGSVHAPTGSGHTPTGSEVARPRPPAGPHRPVETSTAVPAVPVTAVPATATPVTAVPIAPTPVAAVPIAAVPAATTTTTAPGTPTTTSPDRVRRTWPPWRRRVRSAPAVDRVMLRRILGGAAATGLLALASGPESILAVTPPVTPAVQAGGLPAGPTPSPSPTGTPAASGMPFTGPLLGSRPFDYLRDITFSPDGRLVAANGGTSLVQIWDSGTGQPIGEPISAGAFVGDLVFSGDSRSLLIQDEKHGIRWYDLASRRFAGAALRTPRTFMIELSMSRDGRTLVTSGDRNAFTVWNPATRKRVAEVQTTRYTVWGTALRPDGRLVALGHQNNVVELWDVARRKQYGRALIGHTEGPGNDGMGVEALAFSPDGRTLVTGGHDRTIRFWDVGSQRQLGPPLTGNSGSILEVVFSPDGSMVAAAVDNRITIWDVATRRPVGNPLVASDAAYSLAFSPDGRRLAAGLDNGSGQLWWVDGTR
ncbi:Hsp70 family protein [Plantactinospora sp. BB1]|uniref:Hsp70 family protein n=1 Tax=Plantactinospora sp. BB1 TaxID=2071627 RepID=UPI000D155755|nr:Hsp70 family protein [Plantactinospora sp. BB1]AVT37039.1 hypothetical protein C6W10_11840 [Plantactinospora sp. BB1]